MSTNRLSAATSPSISTAPVASASAGSSLDEDSFGFSRVLSDFWFAFVLEPMEAGATRVRVESHFEPKGLKGRIMNAVMIRRKFREVRETALANLKQLAEAASVGDAREPDGLRSTV
jgi:hypothetical protein